MALGMSAEAMKAKTKADRDKKKMTMMMVKMGILMLSIIGTWMVMV